MTTDRRAMWDERYSGDRVWSEGPNDEVDRIVGDWPPGRALDLAAGEGRHAVWLAGLGWTVTAVDFSAVGIARGRAAAEERGLTIDWVVADATEWSPPAGTRYDLILAAYFHLPEDGFSRTTAWLAPGGAFVVVGHALRNLTEGVGGPQDPALLHTPEQLAAAARGLTIERCAEYVRPTADGDAIDIALVARAPTTPAPSRF